MNGFGSSAVRLATAAAASLAHVGGYPQSRLDIPGLATKERPAVAIIRATGARPVRRERAAAPTRVLSQQSSFLDFLGE